MQKERREAFSNCVEDGHSKNEWLKCASNSNGRSAGS